VAIDLVLTDDWELRGDGSGNMRALQFETLGNLLEAYERWGIRASINAEVMQQLSHRRLAGQYPALGELADEWEGALRDAYRRGHDVGFHIHPNWSKASYDGSTWRLEGSWMLLDYSASELGLMLSEAKTELERVVRAVDPSYQCVTFRAGSWAIAPSPHVLPTLMNLGIEIDLSIVPGIQYRTSKVTLDYRQTDERFLPYYPCLEDARRLADGPMSIVCVPTYTFRPSFSRRLAGLIARQAVLRMPSLRGAVKQHLRPNALPVRDAGPRNTSATWSNGARNDLYIADLSMLSLSQMHEVLRSIRRRARRSGHDCVPVVLENHTKDVGDVGPLERFARVLSEASDVEVITLRELAARMRDGRYPILYG
jgi:hypothetical protein